MSIRVGDRPEVMKSESCTANFVLPSKKKKTTKINIYYCFIIFYKILYLPKKPQQLIYSIALLFFMPTTMEKKNYKNGMTIYVLIAFNA